MRTKQLLGPVAALAIFGAATLQGAERLPRQRSAEEPAFPIVIRMKSEVVSDAIPKRINHTGPVDAVVLGTRSVGRSHTYGRIRIVPNDTHEDVAFRVYFEGKLQTRTTGRSGVAVINSRTHTNFVCSRLIQFEPDRGFVAGPTNVRTQTSLIYEGFSSARGGIGSRLVGRIASRRAAQSHDEAERIVAGNQRAALQQAFDTQLEPALVSLNRKLDAIQFASALLRPSPRIQMRAVTTDDALHIGIGPATESGELPTLDVAQAEPVEIWVHAGVLGKRMRAILPVAEFGISDVILKREQRAIASTFNTLVELVQERPSPVPSNAWVKLGINGASDQNPQFVIRSDTSPYVYVSAPTEDSSTAELSIGTSRSNASSLQVVDLNRWLKIIDAVASQIR